MKIFNWVHKKFHHTDLKDGFASNMKKTECTLKNVDSQALLKQVALADVIDDWNDGLLTIGTFGYDPLKSLDQQKEYLALESEDESYEGDGEQYLLDGDKEDNYNVEHEELNPLMHTTFGQNYEDVNANYPDDDVNACKEEKMIISEVLLSPPVFSYEIVESNDAETDPKKKKGERITLADLFLADSDVKLKLDAAKVLIESSEKASLKAKHGLSFTKKLIPRVNDNAHPIKNIKRLMKKMLKRKIHPELDAKNHKPEGQKPSAAGIIDSDQKHEANDDSTSLLPI